MLTDTKTFDLKAFAWDRQNYTLAAEASDLQIPSGEVHREIAVRSHLTGKTEGFRLKFTRRDQEGEIKLWVYAPEHPLQNVRNLIIFND